MEEAAERSLVERISAEGSAAWPEFVEACTPTILRVIGLFARTYDDRMDLFLFVCSKLRENDMKRLRSFRYREEAPCRFTTWLTVVVRNLALDHDRARRGRIRPFRNVESLAGAERAVFEYHFCDGLSLEVVRHRLRQEQGAEIDETELAGIAGRLRRRLSPSQRWRLLARLAKRRGHVAFDPTGEDRTGRFPAPVTDDGGGPEQVLRRREASDALQRALESIGPQVRLTLVLRYRDGYTTRQAAAMLGVRPREVERLAREGLDQIRMALNESGFERPDFANLPAGACGDNLWKEVNA
jgi:RNA polymerase sigma factor (sigma-70 family)